MSASGGRRAIFAAAAANLGIALAKVVGFVITGASAMLAEAIHSLVDTANQGLLLIGHAQASKRPTPEHPFGYGRQRYFYAFLVGLMLFTAGGVFSIYEGLHKLEHPDQLTDVGVAVVILVVCMGLEGMSLRTAMSESRSMRKGITVWQFIRRAKAPELPVVMLEDTAAITGLILALAAILASWATGDPIWDALGTIGIGVLLIIVAVILVFETHSLLVGEGVGAESAARIVRAIEGGPDDAVERVIHLKTLFLGPEELLVAAKVAIVPVSTAGEVAAAIDAAEARLRSASPVELSIYLEPDIYQGAHQPGERPRGTDDAGIAGHGALETEGEYPQQAPRSEGSEHEAFHGLRGEILGDDELPGDGPRH